MATHSFIFLLEKGLVDARETVTNTRLAIDIERSSNESTYRNPHGHGHLHPTNVDVWSTLLVNAEVLQTDLSKLIDELKNQLLATKGRT